MAKYGMKGEVYFKCKECKKILFKGQGALTHLNKTHGIKIKLDQIKEYCSIVKNPPEDVVKEIKAKQESNRINRERMKARKKGEVIPEDTPVIPNGKTNFKCKKCGVVVQNIKTLDGHCRRKHKAGYGKIGYTMTDEPTTRKPYGKQRSRIKTSPNQPQIVGLGTPEMMADGIIIDVKVKIPINFGLPSILPQF